MKKDFMIKRSVMATLMLLAINIYSFAQDKGLDIDVDIDKGNETGIQPWMWVVGGAVFILILVALLRGGKKSA